MISIIIPVYNAESTLHRCVDSVLAQTYTDWECILVDDGSKDSSPQICDEYAAKDKRIRVIHKENGGVSSARNAGLDSIGECDYVAFIDSDDYVDACYLDNMLSTVGTLDLVVGGYAGNGKWKEEEKFEKKKYINNEIGECLAHHLYKVPFLTPWAKLFRTSIITENNLRFNAKLRITEDTVFVQTFLRYCQSLALTDGVNYHYATGALERYKMSGDEMMFTLNTLLDSYNSLCTCKQFTCDKFYSMQVVRYYNLFVSWLYPRRLNPYTYFIYKRHIRKSTEITNLKYGGKIFGALNHHWYMVAYVISMLRRQFHSWLQ